MHTVTIDYELIRKENRKSYGTEVSKYGKTLLADLYSEVDHFVFELLQNTEDAYGRRQDEDEIKGLVEFKIDGSLFECRHFGKPFDEADIRGVCGIASSTKGDSDIGKFGIGFKSVFSVTDRPQIHSGDASFEIVDYVFPYPVDPAVLRTDETLIRLPLSDSVGSPDSLLESLQGHGAASLLFLRHIDTIVWIDTEGTETRIQRVSDELEGGVSRVSLVETVGSQDPEQSEWLLFSREVTTERGDRAGSCQLAFRLEGESGGERVERLPLSPISVVFPTAVESQLGFLIQAPFRTTPSRDNLRSGDPWNESCFQELSELMVESLEWFKANGMLRSESFEALPIDPEDIEKAPLTSPMHDALVEACRTRHVIPIDGGGYGTAESLRLGRSADLRNLLDPLQLAVLTDSDSPVQWVSGDITQDRFPRVRTFMVELLEIQEFTPETAFRAMNRDFLEAQPDEWLRSLYEFLANVPSLKPDAKRKAILRIASGEMVAPFTGELSNAVLPSEAPSSENTVKPKSCDSDKSLAFLESLGLETRQLVDDAIDLLRSEYSEPSEPGDHDGYAEDLKLFVAAAGTDSRNKLEQLHAALGDAYWVRVRDSGSVSSELRQPDECYGPKENLIAIFGHVPGVGVVDWEVPGLVGKEIEALLRASGVAMRLRVKEDFSRFNQDGFREELRATSEQPETTGYTDDIDDFQIVGLEEWFSSLEQLDMDSRSASAGALWKELVKLAGDRGSVFRGIYRWTNYGKYSAGFDSLFVERLRSTEWVPDGDGELRRPDEVEFESTDFAPDPFLQEVIRFKPSGLDDLAEQAGVEPEALALIKRLNISAEQLWELFGDGEEPSADTESADDEEVSGQVEEEGEGEVGEGPVTTDPPGTKTGPTQPGGSGQAGQPTDGGSGTGDTPKPSDSPPGGTGQQPSGQQPGGRKFISYVTADQEEPSDPDRLTHSKRLALEEKAIEFILEVEPEWERTPINNEGFDLEVPDGKGTAKGRYCEVKAMKTSLSERPVTLSRRQFEVAIEEGDSYWIYIVENADSRAPRLVKIQDPAGKANHFTFDQGWREVSE